MASWIALILLVVAGIALVLRHDAGTIAGFNNADFAGIVTAAALLIFLGSGLLRGYRGGMSGVLRDILTWVVFAGVLVVGYSYRDQIIPVATRIAAEIVPGLPVSETTDANGKQSVRIRKQRDGQFVAITRVNKASIKMIVDTGASLVVLTPDDARKAGINPSSLSFSVPIQTANGITTGARVKLRSLHVGAVERRNIDALVARPGALHESLLGMSFLSRLRSYEFSGDFLTLRS